MKSLPVIPSSLIIFGYIVIWFVRSAGLIPDSLSPIPIIETAWLPFLIVIGIIIWMKRQKIPFSRVGLFRFPLSRSLFLLVIVIFTIDFLSVALTTAALGSVFGEAEQVARFQALPGNLPLLLLILPLSWVFVFGEEFFFRGFLLTTLAENFGGSRVAWLAAVFIQGVAFGLIHLEQGPAQVINIGVGGAVFGAVFLYTRKNPKRGGLWPLIIVHGITNTLGFVLLFSGSIVR